MKSRTTALAFVTIIVCVATVPTVGQGQAKLPRMPDGRPELQGTWSKATVTPLERPPYLAGKEFFTEAEAIEWEKGWQQRIAKIIPVDAQINGEIVNNDVNHIYLASGPVIGFRTSEHAESSDPSLRRGNPETDIYVVQALVYAAPELLRTTQTSVAIAAGWLYRSFLIEVRLTRGIQSIFKDREGLVTGFVEVGGHEPTLRRLIPQFGPFLESAKRRDVAVLAGFRF